MTLNMPYLVHIRRYPYMRSLMNCYVLLRRSDYIFFSKLRSLPFPPSIAYGVLSFEIVVELSFLIQKDKKNLAADCLLQGIPAIR